MSSPPISTFTLVAEDDTLAQVNYPPNLTVLNTLTIALSTVVIVVTFLYTIYLQRCNGKTIFIADNAHPEYPKLPAEDEEADIELRERRKVAKPATTFRYGPGMTNVQIIPAKDMEVDEGRIVGGTSDEPKSSLRYPGHDEDGCYYNTRARPARSVDSSVAVGGALSGSSSRYSSSRYTSTQCTSYDEDEYHTDTRERERARNRHRQDNPERFLPAPQEQERQASPADTDATCVHIGTGFKKPVKLNFGDDRYEPSYIASTFVPREGLDDY